MLLSLLSENRVSVGHSLFSGINQSYSDGGVIALGNNNDLSVLNCSFEEIEGKSGGCICLYENNRCEIDSCNFSSNKASIAAGAIYSIQSWISITNSNFIS